MVGELQNVVVPGWVRSASPPATLTPACQEKKDWCDCLGYSLECEGNGLQILSYYRCEGISDEEWLQLSLHQRFQKIGGNWALLKCLLHPRHHLRPFIWMNRNLTIEDAGFLWEVSYGGKTPGFTIDPEHLIQQIFEVVECGLTAVDREMDSGIQVHVSFPFLRGEDLSVSESVLCLMVHLDDYISLNTFDKSIIDDCNNMWANADVAALMAALRKGGEKEVR